MLTMWVSWWAELQWGLFSSHYIFFVLFQAMVFIHLSSRASILRAPEAAVLLCYLIYKDECLFVPYTNPHFWTDMNQTLHTSPPWSGRDPRVCMGPQYFTFPTFSAYFVGGWCRFFDITQLPAPHYTATALYPWCAVCWCDITHGGFCNENAEKWNERVCENGNLMRREGSDQWIALAITLHLYKW
jgi:hypothetical protein